MNEPVFIVGMPRSGTKLLRELLNQHSFISIPKSESHFIPYFVNHFSKEGGMETVLSDEELYAQLIATPFYRNMSVSGTSLNFAEFQNGIRGSKKWSDIFRFILKHFSENPNAEIWGDKTPGYLNYIGMIYKLYPDAKFVHILRDPRDYCISVRNIWNKSMYRAAHVWNQTITEFNESTPKEINVYIVRYEELINDPRKVLTGLTDWLGLQFEESMLTLDNPSENHGAAKGMLTVKKDNSNKFLMILSEPEIRRIEEIVKPSLELMGYTCTYEIEHKPIHKLSLLGYALYDAWNSAAFHIKEKGLFSGLKYFKNLHLLSSWRTNA